MSREGSGGRAGDSGRRNKQENFADQSVPPGNVYVLDVHSASHRVSNGLEPPPGQKHDEHRVIELQARNPDWQDALAKKGQQATIIGDERNVLRALRSAPELVGLVYFDEFGLTVRFRRSPPWRKVEPDAAWTDEDDTALVAWLQDRGIAVRGKNVVADCIVLVARDSAVHPLRRYLNALEWDGTERISSWLVDYLGADGNEEYLSAVGRCWLISAVARAMDPGCKADYMLVLESGQGDRKSSMARVMAGGAKWFADSLGDLRNKDSAIQLCGKWIIEIAELTSIRGTAKVEAVKAYLSRTDDTYDRHTLAGPSPCLDSACSSARRTSGNT